MRIERSGCPFAFLRLCENANDLDSSSIMPAALRIYLHPET
jgi:hypothetical protein